MPFRLTLIRHGEAVGASSAIFGHSNPPLSPLGLAQLQARWRGLTSQPIDAIASSTLARCADFALDAAQALGLPLQLEAGFREIHLGSIDGKPKSEWTTEDHTHWDNWQRDPAEFPLPGGEDWLAFQRRVLGALSQWASQGEAEHRVIIAHQGTIKAIMLFALGLPASRHQQFWLAPGGAVTLWWDEVYPPLLLEWSNTLPDVEQAG
ncbi:histidine phosphatase family protein [Chitinibacter tainanensis]|uniref:histidine phosphatase family protein n=1 Tax=Chitinibacter tainanensis TaxID=230667 RepID=UPI002353EB6F|nr:histidine phosphatase family protein [Chitinibacter tainanensis]